MVSWAKGASFTLTIALRSDGEPPRSGLAVTTRSGAASPTARLGTPAPVGLSGNGSGIVADGRSATRNGTGTTWGRGTCSCPAPRRNGTDPSPEGPGDSGCAGSLEEDAGGACATAVVAGVALALAAGLAGPF